MSFGDFENLGEKNKRGSVDLDIFTVGVSTFLCNGNALTLSRLPQFRSTTTSSPSHNITICVDGPKVFWSLG